MSLGFTNYGPQVTDGLMILLAKMVGLKGGSGLNLIPAGAQYNGAGGYAYNSLAIGGTYKIILGSNDTSASSTPMTVSGVGNQATWVAAQTQLLLNTLLVFPGPVTAQLYRLS